MISIDELADILNRELTDEFIEALQDRWEEGDVPIDPEHPEMEAVLESITDSINELDELSLDTEYD